MRDADIISAAVVPEGREKQSSVSFEAIIQGIDSGVLSPPEGGRKPCVQRRGSGEPPKGSLVSGAQDSQLLRGPAWREKDQCGRWVGGGEGNWGLHPQCNPVGTCGRQAGTRTPDGQASPHLRADSGSSWLWDEGHQACMCCRAQGPLGPGDVLLTCWLIRA